MCASFVTLIVSHLQNRNDHPSFQSSHSLFFASLVSGSGKFPIEVNERSSLPVAYSELCRDMSWLFLSPSLFDAYCRWNMFDEGEKELTIFMLVARNAPRKSVFQSRQQRWVKERKREREKEEWKLKKRRRKAKAYPPVLYATTNSRSDCNVRRFVDFDGAWILQYETADI